jgi:hypothetical protein
VAKIEIHNINEGTNVFKKFIPEPRPQQFSLSLAFD